MRQSSFSLLCSIFICLSLLLLDSTWALDETSQDVTSSKGLLMDAEMLQAVRRGRGGIRRLKRKGGKRDSSKEGKYPQNKDESSKSKDNGRDDDSSRMSSKGKRSSSSKTPKSKQAMPSKSSKQSKSKEAKPTTVNLAPFTMTLLTGGNLNLQELTNTMETYLLEMLSEGYKTLAAVNLEAAFSDDHHRKLQEETIVSFDGQAQFLNDQTPSPVELAISQQGALDDPDAVQDAIGSNPAIGDDVTVTDIDVGAPVVLPTNTPTSAPTIKIPASVPTPQPSILLNTDEPTLFPSLAMPPSTPEPSLLPPSTAPSFAGSSPEPSSLPPSSVPSFTGSSIEPSSLPPSFVPSFTGSSIEPSSFVPSYFATSVVPSFIPSFTGSSIEPSSLPPSFVPSFTGSSIEPSSFVPSYFATSVVPSFAGTSRSPFVYSVAPSDVPGSSFVPSFTSSSIVPSQAPCENSCYDISENIFIAYSAPQATREPSSTEKSEMESLTLSFFRKYFAEVVSGGSIDLMFLSWQYEAGIPEEQFNIYLKLNSFAGVCGCSFNEFKVGQDVLEVHLEEYKLMIVSSTALAGSPFEFIEKIVRGEWEE